MIFLLSAKAYAPGVTFPIKVFIRSRKRHLKPKYKVYHSRRTRSETRYFIPGSKLWDAHSRCIYYSCTTRSGTCYFIPGDKLWDVHCVREIPDDTPSELDESSEEDPPGEETSEEYRRYRFTQLILATIKPLPLP